MSSPLNNWALSKAVGESMERGFASTMFEFTGLVTTKENDVDKRKPDLAINVDVDIKFLQSAYPSTPTPAGLPNSKHCTLDVSNIERYSPATMLFLVVDYRGSGLDTCGVYLIAAGKVQKLMQDFPGRIYRRSGRTTSDKIVKVAISTDEMALLILPGMTKEESVEAMKTRAA